MKQYTSIVLAVVALGLAAFLFYDVRYCATSEELEQRSGRVLPGFDRDRVDRIVLGQGDDRIELERNTNEADAGPPGSAGHWRITHPRQLEADVEAIDSLMTAVDWLEKRRTVSGDNVVDQDDYGLKSPRARIQIRLRGRDRALLVGGEAPGDAVYLAVAGENDEVYAVNDDFLEQIDKDVNDLRDRRLAELRVSRVQALRVTGRFHATRRSENRWELETPVAMRADAGAVEDVARNLERLRTERFVADDVDDDGLAEYGLDQPRAEVTLRLNGQDEAVTLRFGGACEDHQGEVYATRMGSGTVACVDEEVVTEHLAVDPETLQEMRVVSLRADELAAITLTRGERSLTLRREGTSWRYGGEGDDDEGTEADTDAVEAMIDALRGARATEVVTDLESAGLSGDAPEGALVVRLEPEVDDREGETLTFTSDDERALVTREGGSVALVISPELLSELSVDPLHYRDRLVLNEDSSEAGALEVTREGVTQRLERRDGSWWLTSPVEARADQVVVGRIIRGMARLDAESFVAEEPLPEHGLTRPELRAVLSFEVGGAADAGGEARQRVLVIGAEAGEGRFARLEGDDASVFIISGELIQELSSPLLDRNVFASEEDVIDGVVIEQGEARHQLERDDDRWLEGGAEVAESEMERILARLSAARAAEVVSFDAPGAAMELDPPRARVVVHRSEVEEGEPEELEILIGAEYGDDDERRVYARRADLEAIFGLPTRVVEPLLSYGAEEPESSGEPDGGAGSSEAP